MHTYWNSVPATHHTWQDMKVYEVQLPSVGLPKDFYSCVMLWRGTSSHSLAELPVTHSTSNLLLSLNQVCKQDWNFLGDLTNYCTPSTYSLTGLCNVPAFYLDHWSLHIKLHMCIVSHDYYCTIFKNLWTGNLGCKQRRLHKLKMERQKKC